MFYNLVNSMVVSLVTVVCELSSSPLNSSRVRPLVSGTRNVNNKPTNMKPLNISIISGIDAFLPPMSFSWKKPAAKIFKMFNTFKSIKKFHSLH